MRVGLCCSSRQRAFACNLAARLERNLGIATLIVEDDASPVSVTWDQASASDAVLLLLDSVSAPGPAVNRQDWEGLLEHAGAPPVALICFEPCHYPKLLERRRFLTPASAAEAGRWVERWLTELLLPRDDAGIAAAPIAPPPSIPDEWWTELVDRPGVCVAAATEIDAAQAFARETRRHFQGVFWIGCEHRPAAAILDELEHWSRGATRLLFVLAHHNGPLPDLSEPGRHSYLVLEGTPPMAASTDEMARWAGVCQASGFPGVMMDLMLGSRRPEWEALVTVLDRERDLYRPHGRFLTNRRARQRHLEVLEETFRSWRLQTPLCRELVAEAAAALRYGFESNSPAARNLCMEFSLFLLSEKRNPEAVGWLRVLVEEAVESDAAIARRARNELQWLVDDVGAPLAEVVEAGVQLGFDWNA